MFNVTDYVTNYFFLLSRNLKSARDYNLIYPALSIFLQHCKPASLFATSSCPHMNYIKRYSLNFCLTKKHTKQHNALVSGLPMSHATQINASQRNAVLAEKLNESLKDSKDSIHWVQFESPALFQPFTISSQT